MGDYSRRKFIKATLLGIGALSFPSLPILGKNTIPILEDNIKNEPDLLATKKEAADLFFRREYGKSESLYKKMIGDIPSDISNYDGLIKIYAKQHRNLDTVRLLQKGLEQNKSNPLFYDRLARALARVSLGNNKLEKEYKSAFNDSFPIKTSISLYLQAIELAPNKRYLREGLLDMQVCLDKKNKQLEKAKQPVYGLDATLLSEIESKVVAYKGDWHKSRKSKKNNKIGLSENNIQRTLSELDKKQRRKLYFDDEVQSRYKGMEKYKKECYSALFISALSNDSLNHIEQYYREIKSIDKTETNLKAKLTRYLKKHKQYEKLIDLYKFETSIDKKNIWNEIGIAQTLFQMGNYTESEIMLKQIQRTDNEDSPKFYGAIHSGIAKCRFQSKQYEAGREELMKGMKILLAGGVTSSLVIDYAMGYMQENNYQEARDILSKLVGKGENITLDEEINNIILSIQKFEEEKKANTESNKSPALKSARALSASQQTADKGDLTALYALAKLHEKQGNTQLLNEVLQAIKEIDPEDGFLKKRL